MSNPFYYLVGLLLAFSYPTGFEPPFFPDLPDVGGVPVLILATLGSLLLLAAASAAAHRRLVATGRTGRLGWVRMLLKVLALVLHAALVFVFHLPLQVGKLGLEDNTLLGGLLLLLPLMLFYGTLACVAARAEAALRGIASEGYLRFAFRSFLALSFLPVLFILGIDFLFGRVPWLRKLVFIYPFMGWMGTLAFTLLFLVFMPSLLRAAFGARPLPSGPMRDRLERLCRSAGFRYGELLSVHTGGGRLATAFIAGLAAPWRHVFFTDAILDGMGPEELECVLAHVIAHSQRKHVVCYFIAASGYLMVSVSAHEVLTWTGAGPLAVLVLTLGMAVLFWVVLFGFVSRRFESEADLAAARTAPPVPGACEPYVAARGMAAALDAVADLNRIPVSAWSWRHFNIARRIDILLRAEAEPEWGRAFERRCGRLRAAAAGLLITGLIGGAWVAARQFREADANRAQWERQQKAGSKLKAGA